MDTTRSLDKFTCPFGGQEVELVQVDYEAGGMPCCVCVCANARSLHHFRDRPATAERWAAQCSHGQRRRRKLKRWTWSTWHFRCAWYHSRRSRLAAIPAARRPARLAGGRGRCRSAYYPRSARRRGGNPPRRPRATDAAAAAGAGAAVVRAVGTTSILRQRRGRQRALAAAVRPRHPVFAVRHHRNAR